MHVIYKRKFIFKEINVINIVSAESYGPARGKSINHDFNYNSYVVAQTFKTIFFSINIISIVFKFFE